MERQKHISSRRSSAQSFSSSSAVENQHFHKKNSRPPLRASRPSYQFKKGQPTKKYSDIHSDRTGKPAKMPNSVSLKRPAPNDDDHPFKKKIIEVQDPAFKNVSTRIKSTMTSSEIGLYERRRRIAKPIDVISRKRAMASKVNSSWAGMPVTSQKGMPNITGVTCYRVSLLQALFHQPQFVHWLLELHRPQNCVSDFSDRCITCVIRYLATEYWKESQSSFTNIDIFEKLHDLFHAHGWAPDVSYGQADPDEQATWIFEKMRAELPTSLFGCLESIIQPVSSTVVRCRQCAHESRTNGIQDRTLAISLKPAIPNGTLSMYLKRYMMEKVEGYRCDHCKDDKCHKDKQQVMSYAPQVLSVQVKCVVWERGRAVKVKIPVKIEPTLDLNPYRDTYYKDDLKYSLVAVIRHQGSGGKAGHYICSAKGPDGMWFNYNDSTKRKSTFEDAVSSTSSFTPYMMFYQRKGSGERPEVART